MKKLLIINFLIIIVGILILPIVYLKNIFTLSFNGLVLIEITLLILTPLLIVTFRDEKEITTFFLNFSITKIVIILFGIIIFIIAYTEMIILGYTYFLTLSFLFVALFIALFGRGKHVAKIALAIAIVGGLISALYGFYVPTFGADTWRDVSISKQIIITGSFESVSIRHPAYPIPLVPLLYTVMSLSLGFSPVWSNSISGFAYLVLLPLFIYYQRGWLAVTRSHTILVCWRWLRPSYLYGQYGSYRRRTRC
ncbi:hypothetical protein Pogu_2055 [Pyrobaculum oguniense TE7]|uniref:Uncharacterized protein n=1 Tax=Pyrobaculum oguniense (strain DSM 13380 / JCM 10595 / TE7) TaxID=698757 RepID=H6QB85_PYROT|nr:hypothetical protein Pogu_2055 [Pyrobaculum oguniense TE7]